MSRLRILFASLHGYLDPSNGASTATRDLLELLAARGHDCRAFTATLLDYAREVPAESLLLGLGMPFRRASALLPRGGKVKVFDLELGGVRVTQLPTTSSRIGSGSPNRSEAAAFLELADQIFARFRPHVMLTYGGHPTCRDLMSAARRRGVRVVFHVHNFAYKHISAFHDADAVLVPTEHARRHYESLLGLDCHALPLPINPGRVVAGVREPRFLTFVNPVPEKGITVFARIAAELGRRRPEIPLLIVEGRRAADDLARVGIDLSGLTSLHRMSNTPDPRAFYRVTKALLVPSLWRENAALVAREAMANGIPVLASDRGALPEVLGDAGLLLAVPQRCTPTSGVVPTATEVAPWVQAIERLWDDPSFEAGLRERALRAARRLDGRLLGESYERFFMKFYDEQTAPDLDRL